MYLNTFAQSTQPLDMTRTDEFRSLLASAADLGIPHAPDVPYRSCNIVLRQHAVPFPGMGCAGCAADRAAAWRAPVGAFLGPGQPAPGARYRVLALDQRGHGDSEWARDVEYSNHEMSLDAEAFIAALGLERPILMGHSMGGRNAMLLTKTQSVTAGRAGDRRCRPGGVGSRAAR